MRGPPRSRRKAAPTQATQRALAGPRRVQPELAPTVLGMGGEVLSVPLCPLRCRPAIRHVTEFDERAERANPAYADGPLAPPSQSDRNSC